MNSEPMPEPSKANSTFAPIDIGIIIAGHMPPAQCEVIARLPSELTAWLSHRFTQFQWRFQRFNLPTPTSTLRQEPAHLLDEGSRLRDLHKWDFGLIITASDLVSRYKSYTLAATSSALDLAVISTHRLTIQPRAKYNLKSAPSVEIAPEANGDQHDTLLLAQLKILCLRAIAHLAGLSSSVERNNLMVYPQSPDDLLVSAEIDSEQCSTLTKNLQLIADPRLEEVNASKRLSKFHFYIRSSWINRHEIIDAVTHAKPWEFPFRLLRLSAAAISTLLILLITAETWQLAEAQGPFTLAFMMTAALCCTTIFVTFKQRLLIRSHTKQLREQSVITHISAFLIVSIGMITTALTLIVVTLILGYLLYPSELISQWTGTNNQLLPSVYWQTACLVSAEGILIGALGASFEEQYHFRHIVFIDEEL